MYLEIEGLKIQYEDRGGGEPILLLHGWMASIEAMRPIADAVVNMGMRAISLDFPGFGGSDEPNVVFGVEDYARITLDFIKRIGLVRPDVICHSFGGRVAIMLSSADDTLFNRLVFVDAAGIRPKRGLAYYFRTYKYKLGKRLSKIKWIDNAFKLSEKRQNAGSSDYRELKSDIMRGTFVKVVNLDLTGRLKCIKNPVLLIWGTEDTSTPLYMAKIMNKLIPDSGLVELQGAGHFSYIDKYVHFCAVIKAFFKP